MSDYKSIIRNASRKLFSTGFFHIFGGNVINKVVSFLSSIILVRILTKSEYGTFTYAWNIYSIVLIFNGMGIDSGMLQMSSEHGGDPQYTKGISNYGTRFGLLFNILLSLTLTGIGLFAPLQIDGGRRLLYALCLLPMFQFLLNMTTCYLRSQKRNQEFAKLSVFNTVVLLIVSAVSAYLLREMGLVIGYYVSSICSCAVGVLAYHVLLINKEPFDLKKDRRDLLKIGFITMVNNGLSQLLYLLDVFVLGIVDPQETVLASYKVATMIPSALTFVPLSIITYLYPYFAEHKDDGKWCIRRYKQVFVGLGSFNLIISVVLFSIAPFIIKLLFGEQYLDAVPVFRILAINYFISGTFRILSGNILVTQRKLKFNLIVAIVSSLTNAIADYFFIQWWGAMGAAYATVLVVIVSSIMSTTYLWITFKKKAAG